MSFFSSTKTAAHPGHTRSFVKNALVKSIWLVLIALSLAACGGGGSGDSGGGTGSTDCILDTSAKLDSCKLG